MHQSATLEVPPSSSLRGGLPPSEKPWGGRLGSHDGDDDAPSQADLEAVERAEHTENVARCRLVWSILAPGCLLLFAVELLLRDHHSSVAQLALYVPLASLSILGGALLVVSRRAVSPPLLRTLDATVYASLAVAGAFLAAQAGGFESHLVDGLACLIVAQGLAMPDHYKAGAVRLAATLVAFLAAMISIAAWLSPEMARQFHAARHPVIIIEQLTMMLLVSAITLGAGHAFWRGRRVALTTRMAGRYILEKRIGRGGMGDVWLARLPALHSELAVKILRADVVNPEVLTRFGREISALTELRHPNTVRVFDWGAMDGVVYYVMERLIGETLRATVEREGALAPERAVHIVRQAARALAEAHSRGVVHRDVKPDNLFLTRDEPDFVKLLDFGIAKARPFDLEEGSITRAGTVLGTAEYMAPEQVIGSPVDTGADIYALGAVLFYALTGGAPFTGTVREVMRAHLTAAPPDVSDVAPRRVPRALTLVVRRCLEKEPTRRYLSAASLDTALAAALITPEIPDIGHEDTHEDDEPGPTLPSGMRSLRAPPLIVLREAHAPGEPSLPPSIRPPRRAAND